MKINSFCKIWMKNWDLSVCLHIVRTVPSDCFVHLFKGGSPRVVAPARRERKNAVSFWELFLCGSCPKEKVDKRQAVVIVSGTKYSYQDSLAAFL